MQLQQQQEQQHNAAKSVAITTICVRECVCVCLRRQCDDVELQQNRATTVRNEHQLTKLNM